MIRSRFTHHAWIPAAAIVLLGFLLRINQAGRYSFWFDEAGVATAAASPSLWQALDIAREHAAAMPLDYIIAWGMARFSLEEGWLRLPSVVWGTFSIAAAYVLFGRLTAHKPVQRIAALLVATSPLLIQYSQELRFYSAGLFFYLISAIFLLRALDRNRLSDWLACLATLVIGFYFHIYTLLALLNGFVWIFQFGWQNLFERSRLRNIVITGLILLGLVFPGFVRFSAETTYAYGQSLALALNSLVIGLGWLPFSGWEQSGIVYTLLCCLFSVVGIVAIFRSKERIFVGLLFGLFIQVLLVFLADVITGYFFAPRQFLFLMPFSYLLAARGLWFFWQKATPLFGHTSDLIKMEGIRRVNRIFSAGLFAVLLGYNGLALTGYYAFPKSYTREVSQVLAEIYQPGDHFRTIPSFEPLAYQFYLEHKLQDHRFSGAFETVSMAEIGKPPKVPGRIYVACKFPLLETEQQVLLTAGFQPLQSGVLGGSQLLWYRDD